MFFCKQKFESIKQFLSMNKKIIIKIFGIVLITYLLFSVGKTLYQSWTVSKEVASLNKQITELGKSNDDYKSKLLYYQSPSYREKIARERFGLQKPGEEVMVIVSEEKPKAIEEKPIKKLTNYQKWWEYFFGTISSN